MFYSCYFLVPRTLHISTKPAVRCPQIHNASDSKKEGLIVALNHVVMFCSERGFETPVPVRAAGGDFITRAALPISSGGGKDT